MTTTGEELRAWTLAESPTPDLVAALSRPKALELVVELAHDLRSPLASVLVLAEMLHSGRSGPLSVLQQEQVRMMYSAVRSLCSVTEDVMELAKAGGETTLGPRVPFVVNDVLGAVRDVARPMATARGIELRVVSQVRETRVGHPRALERVLLNLVTNAIKFTDEGWVEVSVRPEGELEQVVFAVRDSGRGISRTAAMSLLDPFPQPTAREPRGFSSAGIGLMVCRRITEALGTTLRLDSRVQQGSRFHFALTLPFARD